MTTYFKQHKGHMHMKKCLAFIILLISVIVSGCAGKNAGGSGTAQGTGAAGNTSAQSSGGTASQSSGGQQQNETKDKNSKDGRDFFAMDTYISITAYGEHCTEAVEAGKAEIERLEQLISTEIDTSEISILNHEKKAELSEDTAYLLKRAKDISEQTDGAFDIAIYPLMQEWGFPSKNYHVPEQSRIDELLKICDISGLELHDGDKTEAAEVQAGNDKNADSSISAGKPETQRSADAGAATEAAAVAGEPSESSTANAASAEFTIDGMEVDLGGIAKGYASSRLMDVFRECGVTSGIVDLGGNVQTLGYKPDGSLWRVGIKDPDDQTRAMCTLGIHDKTVITSGGYQRFFEENGVRYHHIIDPDTGYPADSGLLSVSIISDDGTLADALSTSLFIMGLDKAAAFWLEHSDEFDAVFYTSDRKLYITEGLKEDYSSPSKTYVIKKK